MYSGSACQRAQRPAHSALCQEFKRQRAKAAALPTLTLPLPPLLLLLAAARAGDADAQYDVGVAYALGSGVAQSWSSAFEWWTRCTARPAPPVHAWVSLGVLYCYCRGVAADAAEAARHYCVGADAGDATRSVTWRTASPTPLASPRRTRTRLSLLTAAAAQDDPTAIMNLGVCYAEGMGVVPAVPRAVALWQRVLAHPIAATSTVSQAAYNLGITYYDGDDGMVRNRELAVRYWRQAAANGHETAARWLAERGLA